MLFCVLDSPEKYETGADALGEIRELRMHIRGHEYPSTSMLRGGFIREKTEAVTSGVIS